MAWEIQQLIDATQGVLSGELLGEESVRFDSVSTDSRHLQSGALYIAIKGERFDGHDFVTEAVKQGAVAVLISEPMATIVPAVLVEDTRIALGQFAAWHRQEMPLKTLFAITGSNGKTTTKEMLAHILGKQAPVLATKGNLNNDFGVPRTLLQISKQHQYAVIEMGANHPHEIRYLTHLAKPDVAMITLAAGAHLEGFGSLQGVIDTKGEIFEGVVLNGTAVINTDSVGYAQWRAQCEAQGLQVISFGEAEEANVRLVNFKQTDSFIELVLRLDVTQFTDSENLVAVKMPLLGHHNALNTAAVVSCCFAAGLNWDEIRPGLVDFRGVSGRLQQLQLPHGHLIDDTYNANPASVKAGIDTLVALPGKGALCLGAMAELGQDSESLHHQVALYAKQQGVQALLLYGEKAKSMQTVFGENAYWFDSHQALVTAVIELIQTQKIQNVLVKGSRSTTMERVSQEVAEAFGHTLTSQTSGH